MKLSTFEVVGDGGVHAKFDDTGLHVTGLTARHALLVLEFLEQGIPALEAYRTTASSIEAVVEQFRSALAGSKERAPAPAAPVAVLHPPDVPPVVPMGDAPVEPSTQDKNAIRPECELVGHRARLMRKLAGLTRAQMAAKLSVSESMLSMLESGRRRVTDDYRDTYRQVCGYDVFAVGEPLPELPPPPPKKKRFKARDHAPKPPEVVSEPEVSPMPEESGAAVLETLERIGVKDADLPTLVGRPPEALSLTGTPLDPNWTVPATSDWARPSVYPADVPLKWEKSQVRLHPVFGDAALALVKAEGRMGGFFYLRPPPTPDVGWAGASVQVDGPVLDAPPCLANSAYDAGYMAKVKTFLQGILYAIYTGHSTRAQVWDVISRNIQDRRGVFENYTPKFVYDAATLRDTVFWLAEFLLIGHEDALRIAPGTFWERTPAMYLYVRSHRLLVPPARLTWPETSAAA